MEDEEDCVYSWGSNDYGQLGRVPNAACISAQIVHFPLRFHVASVACGWKHSLLATTDGDVFAWGSGRHGQLGLGTQTLKSRIPKRIETLVGTGVTNVFCGWEHSVFRTSSGHILTCGSNRHGQLGVSTTCGLEASEKSRKKANEVFVQVADPRDCSQKLRTVQVGCGWHFVMCITETGELVTWGKGGHGQLGLGEFIDASEPKYVPFLHTVRQVTCGSEHSMVLTTSGDLYTCGWGEHGNLGKL